MATAVERSGWANDEGKSWAHRSEGPIFRWTGLGQKKVNLTRDFGGGTLSSFATVSSLLTTLQFTYAFHGTYEDRQFHRFRTFD